MPPVRTLETVRRLAGDDWFVRARARWSSLELDELTFAEHVAAHLTPLTEDTLQLAHLEDLYLACACLLRVPGALSAFEVHALPRIDPVVRRYDSDPGFVDEVRALVRERLFMPPPRIAEYSGLGPLVSWLRAMAARLALNHLQPTRRRARVEAEELDDLPFAAPDPALAILQGAHRATFRTAFQQALRALPVRERTALKLNALDGVTLDKLGAMYRCDKSTVSRWLAHAHAFLLEHTRSNLQASLSLTESDVDSLMVALHSQVAPSLLNLLEE